MDEDPARNAEAAAIGEALYGTPPQVRKLHSENNYVCLLTFEDGRRKVIKMAERPHLQTAVEQEIVAVRRLAAAGMEVPTIEYTAADFPGASTAMFTMEFVAEGDLSSACMARLPWAETGCRNAGEFVRRLHSLPPSLVEGLVPQHAPIATNINWEHWTLREAWDRADVELRRALSATRSRINEQLAAPPTTVVHDSLIANHVLTDDGDRFAVNDWETLRLGYAERDLACFLAGLKTWTNGTPEQAAAFVEGYTGGPPLNEDVARRTEDWQVYYLMNWAAFYLRLGREEGGGWLLGLAREQAVGADRKPSVS